MKAINPGQILIYLAALSSIYSLFMYLTALTHGENNREKFDSFMRMGRLGSYTSLALVSISSVLLFIFFLNDEFAYAYVFNNSARSLPILYKIAGFWAGNEGSFLLWLFILSVMVTMVKKENDQSASVVLPILTIIQLFIIFILTVTSPFEFIWDFFPRELKPGQIPGDGSGINPLLMDPWMVAHPPVLFLGYASAAIPFAYALAALIKRNTHSWIEDAKPWIYFSMISLGIGIFMGAYWAYKVLGWGGYWGWDPVENSSLIPWLVSVALVHGLLLEKKTGQLTRLNIILTITYFILVFYSTFLTRSGILSNFSVHSFGESTLTVYLLVFILIALGASLFIFFTRRPEKKETGTAPLWSQVTLFGIIYFIFFAFIVLMGTSWPIITGLISKTGTSVTTSFYNNLSIPFGVITVILMALGTMSMGGLKKTFLSKTTLLFIVLSIILGIVANIFITKHPVPILFTALGLWLFFQNSYELIKGTGKSSRGARIAHMGVAVFIIGVVISGYHSSMTQQWCRLNEKKQADDISLTFKGFSNEKFSRAQFILEKGNKTIPFGTDYFIDPKSESLYREPFILSDMWGDLYITPEQHKSGEEGFSTALISINQTVLIGNLSVKFEGFNITGMKKRTPLIYAKVRIKGKEYMPGITISDNTKKDIPAFLGNTGRKILLSKIDPQGKRIELYIEPEKGKEAPKDVMIVNISHKKFIWLVWLGTLIITGGSLLAMGKKREA